MMKQDAAATVVRRNGAWLVLCSDPLGDHGSEEEVDAASSLRLAKRIAREMAEGFGFTGPFRWREAEPTLWHLSAVMDEDAVNDERWGG